MDVQVGTIQGLEEPEPLNVVHVEMGQEQIDACHLNPDGFPQTADPSSGIQHHQSPVIASDLNT
jgi:hypothetical protein